MLSHLNFVPEQKRSSIRKFFALLIAFRVMIIITVLVLFFSGVTFALSLLYDSEIDRVKNEQKNTLVVIQGDEGASIEDAINTLNATTKKISTIQAGDYYLTDLLTSLTTLIPQGITLESLTALKETNTLQISGVADSRESHTALRTALTTSPLLKEVSLPLTFLKENISFSFSATLQSEELNK